ncbi:hypothetical protein IP79_13085, partial [Porphyrobacter sp. AAP60]
MPLRFALASLALAASCTAPAFASEGEGDAAAAEAEASVQTDPQSAPGSDPRPAGAPPSSAFAKPVFDETWATIGLGAAMVPSYAGSNDYIAFPLPLIVGRIGGVGISPNGPGFVLDLNS